MLRDASQKQVIHKFSFIDSLDIEKLKAQAAKTPAVDASSPELVTANANSEQASAIVSTTETASTIDTNWYQLDSDNYSLSLAEIVKYSAAANVAQERRQERNYIGKILFALATGYCLFVLWWLFGDRGSRVLTAWLGGKQLVLSKSDVEFIDYAERSLSTIERDIADSKEKSGEGDRVVYVPVYTPPAPSPAPSAANLPLTALPHNTASIPAPAAQSIPEPLKIPAPPPLPEATPIEKEPEVAVAKPVSESTLIGILELAENKSAALIKVEGKTRRIWLGERVNNDGWILESVGDQTANISYQGQVRSISVGETF